MARAMHPCAKTVTTDPASAGTTTARRGQPTDGGGT